MRKEVIMHNNFDTKFAVIMRLILCVNGANLSLNKESLLVSFRVHPNETDKITPR